MVADGRRGAEAYVMNLGGSDVALLTSLAFYIRARNQRQLTNFAFEVWDPVWVKYTDN